KWPQNVVLTRHLAATFDKSANCISHSTPELQTPKTKNKNDSRSSDEALLQARKQRTLVSQSVKAATHSSQRD
ncbi:MAG: hypothetical protein VX668_09010, partial [Planctomycetota bacterium]|nr:hypothetical protein [Planctomycetota bacterium]